MTAKIDGRLLEPSRTLKINGNTINYLKVNGKEFWRNVQPLRITKQPTDKAKKDKETLSLSCSVDSGRSTFVKYQWYRDGAKLEGQTGSTLKRTLSLADDGAKWWCRITNDVGTVETRHASTTVKPLKKVIEINENVQNLNLYDEYTRRFPNAEGVEKVEFIIGEGVEVTSVSTSKPALDTGTGWDSKVALKLSVLSDAFIAGRGGDGGDVKARSTPIKAGNGGNGGNALLVTSLIEIHNSGVIGGGGGGGGASTLWGYGGAHSTGGGGASHGSPGKFYIGGGIPSKRRSSGSGGTITNGGKGGDISVDTGYFPVLVRAGNGGSLGQKGGDSSEGVAVSSKGGGAGLAIQGVSNVTFINRGDIRGKTV